MDALQKMDAFSYDKNTRTPFWSLNSKSLAMCAGKYAHLLNAPDFGLGHMTCFGQKVSRSDINGCLKSACTVKPALLYLYHCDDNMFWLVCWSTKEEIYM